MDLHVGDVRQRGSAAHDVVLVKVRSSQQASFSSRVEALRPNDIATVDVSKHAAGTLAPNAVSVVTIVLKPGAAVPPATSR